MSGKLLVEIEQILIEKKMLSAIILLENVEDTLAKMVSILKAKPDALSLGSKQGGLDLQDTAEVLTGLAVLGKKSNRIAYEDFGNSEKFLEFIDEVGDKSAQRKFDGGHETADSFLRDIGRAARSSLAKHINTISKAFIEDSPNKPKLQLEFFTLIDGYQTYYKKLRSSLNTSVKTSQNLPDANLK